MSIRVAITDDHPTVREGLEKMLLTDPEIAITGIYAHGKALLEGLKESTPDVLLLDIHLPDIAGSELVVQVLKQYPGIRPVMLTGSESPFYIKALMASGAKGYILKTSLKDELITAIKTVADGGIYMSGEAKNLLAEATLKISSGVASRDDLSRREQEVLQLIADERSSPEIAKELHLSLRTVENYRLGLMKKLNVKNSAGLIKKALLMGLVRV